MKELQLGSDECELLSQVLQNYLASLEFEIRHTDHFEFRILLKERREMLRHILKRVEQRETVGVA